MDTENLIAHFKLKLSHPSERETALATPFDSPLNGRNQGNACNVTAQTVHHADLGERGQTRGSEAASSEPGKHQK